MRLARLKLVLAAMGHHRRTAANAGYSRSVRPDQILARVIEGRQADLEALARLVGKPEVLAGFEADIAQLRKAVEQDLKALVEAERQAMNSPASTMSSTPQASAWAHRLRNWPMPQRAGRGAHRRCPTSGEHALMLQGSRLFAGNGDPDRPYLVPWERLAPRRPRLRDGMRRIHRASSRLKWRGSTAATKSARWHVRWSFSGPRQSRTRARGRARASRQEIEAERERHETEREQAIGRIKTAVEALGERSISLQTAICGCDPRAFR